MKSKSRWHTAILGDDSRILILISLPDKLRRSLETKVRSIIFSKTDLLLYYRHLRLMYQRTDKGSCGHRIKVVSSSVPGQRINAHLNYVSIYSTFVAVTSFFCREDAKAEEVCARHVSRKCVVGRRSFPPYWRSIATSRRYEISRHVKMGFSACSKNYCARLLAEIERRP